MPPAHTSTTTHSMVCCRWGCPQAQHQHVAPPCSMHHSIIADDCRFWSLLVSACWPRWCEQANAVPICAVVGVRHVRAWPDSDVACGLTSPHPWRLLRSCGCVLVYQVTRSAACGQSGASWPSCAGHCPAASLQPGQLVIGHDSSSHQPGHGLPKHVIYLG
jgi:hypothetical protein